MADFWRNIAVGAMQKAPWLETVATALRLPEKAISEQAAGWQPTKYTRGGPLQVWAAENFDVAPGARETNVAVQQAKDAGTFYKTPPPTQTTTGGTVNLPQAPTGGGGGGDDWGRIYQTYYQGWNEEAAKQDFYNTRRGNEGTFGTTGPGAEEIMRQQLRGQVESIYQPVFESLDRLAGLLPGWKEEKLGTIGNLYQTQLGELGGAQEAARQRLEGYRGEIRADQAQNLKALAESMRNWARAGQIQLGSWGAGSSSATPMYQYALAKEAGKRGTDIARQSSAMFNDLRMKEEDINLAYNQSKSQLDTWKTEQMGAITDWYNTQLSNIEQQKATASGERARALASAENSLIQEAYNRLLNIQDQAQQWDAAMREWAINRLASIDDMKMQLGQMANYSPQQIVWNELQGMGSMPQQSYEAWNPYARKAREEEERFAGTWR